ncbi:MAG: hypothetical protein AAF335_00030 [Bacteroidota bacterium]
MLISFWLPPCCADKYVEEEEKTSESVQDQKRKSKLVKILITGSVIGLVAVVSYFSKLSSEEKKEAKRREKEEEELERSRRRRAETERLENERLRKEEAAEQERLRKKKEETERLEKERIKKEKAEQERLKKGKAKAKRLAQKRLENKRRLTDNFLTLKEIDNFFDQNKDHFIIDRIKKKEKNELKPNDKVMQTWIEKEKEVIKKSKIRGNVPLKEALKWPEKYIAALKKNYVSWTILDEQMAKLAESVRKEIQKKECKTIYFLVPGNIQKSAAWIFFILWGYLNGATYKEKGIRKANDQLLPKDKIYRFISGGGDLNSSSDTVSGKLLDILAQLDENNDKTWCFLVDDMAYSGAQSLNILQHFNNANTGEGRPIPKNFYVTMPYISDQAKYRLLQIDGKINPGRIESRFNVQELNKAGLDWVSKVTTEEKIKFFESTKVIESMEVPEYTGIKAVHQSTIPIVLNSKIADEASILQAEMVLAIVGDQETETTREEYNQLKQALMAGKREGFFHGWSLKYSKDEATKLLNKAYFDRKKSKFFSSDNYVRKSASLLDLKGSLPLPAYYKEKDYHVNKNTIISNKRDSKKKEKGIFGLLVESRGG